MIENFIGKVAVKVFIEDDAGNLLICRKNDSENFEVVGGRIDLDESVESCMQRELKEELDIEIIINDFKILNSFQDTHPHENIQHLYLITNIKISEEVKNQIKLTEEVGEVVWINIKNYKDYKYKKFLENDIEKFVRINN